MKISILLVTYNQQEYIDECLNGIIKQILPFEFEIVVADDFSSDNTLSVIEKRLTEKNLPFLILPTEKNSGISKNYQKGFKQCQGEYIAVIEGDDYWTDQRRLQKHIQFLDEHQECVMSYNRLIVLHEETRRFEVSRWESNDDFEYITTSRLAQGNCIGNLSACVFRNSEIKKIKPDLFELQIADWMLAMVLGQFGLIAKLKDAMSVYRVNSKGKWSGLAPVEKKERIIEGIDIYNNYLKKNFHKEFTIYKNLLIVGEKHWMGRWQKLEGFLPPFLIILAKLIVPERFISFLRRKLTNN